MIPWITTKQFTFDLFPSWAKTEGDKEWSLGAVTIDVADIGTRLDGVIAELNEDQWEIKMVVPLDKSLTYHEHRKIVRAGTRKEPETVLGATGLGWAAGATSAVLIVCQRTEWLDDAEYKARIGDKREKAAAEERRSARAAVLEHNAAINGKITSLQKLLDDAKQTGVETKKSGFLRGEKYVFGGVDYATRGEADAAFKARVAELEAELAALPKQLKDVPADA